MLVRSLAADGAVRCVAIDATAQARRTAEVHGLGPSAAWLAAEALVANYLLSAHIKGEEQISLRIRTDAPAADFFGQVDSEGVGRATLSPADLQAPIGAPLAGMFVVVKSIVRKELYRGASVIDGEGLQAALGRHLIDSAQVTARLRLEARMFDGEVAFAGGVLVERLPDEPGMPSLTREEFADRYARLDAAEVRALVEDLHAGTLLGESVAEVYRRPLEWRCRCTPSRTEAAVSALGREAVLELADEGRAEVSCHFCGTTRVVDADRLRELAAALA